KNKLQFVHVDDVARLITYILRDESRHESPVILNVAGRGEALTYEQCVTIAQAKTLRLPGKWLCRIVLSILWKLGVSGVPPEALPYMTGSYLMSTAKLQQFLGKDYENVVRYTVRDALADSFSRQPASTLVPAAAVPSGATK
ncbi:MAG TPA: hypothetical protein VGR50_01065, partial [Terriglobales bacterium]|nr:hypothetical protein [Terriglobales bacterium]